MPPLSERENDWFEKNLYVHEPILRSWLACRFPGVRGETDDIMQEAFVRVMKACELRDLDCPKTFLFAVARNLAVDFLRRRKTIPFESLGENDDSDVWGSDENIPEKVSQIQEQRMLNEAIESLPRRCREIITLRKVYGLSHKEISGRLGVSTKTIEAQISIGIRRMRDYFSQYRKERS